jgi:exportin-2 (importin alpha re-exporter)
VSYACTLDVSVPSYSCPHRPLALTGLVKLFREPQYLESSKTDEEPDLVLLQIDVEEQNVGYQAAYSKLAASELPEVDIVAYVRDPQAFAGIKLSEFSRRHGQKARALIGTAEQGTVARFLAAMAGAGYVI